jgi:hypothetical protein
VVKITKNMIASITANAFAMTGQVERPPTRPNPIPQAILPP